jgi:hypothetical protein
MMRRRELLLKGGRGWKETKDDGWVGLEKGKRMA